MIPITNDHELRVALDRLSPAACRRLASQFTDGVIDLSHDPRVLQAVEVAAREEVAGSLLATAHQAAKTAAAESCTPCGHDTDWHGQAAHFVAAAAAATTAPGEMGNPAWGAALYARMARTCTMIADDRGGTHSEITRQYRLTEAAVATTK